MDITESFLMENDCYKAGKPITPEGIMLHSTAAPGVKAARFLKAWNKPDVEKCVHAFLDDTGIYQVLPWEMRSWHCGSTGNSTHLSFEICEPADLTDDAYFAHIWETALSLCEFLCRKFELSADRVIDHSEGHQLGIASNHADVSHWFPKLGKSMDDFREALSHKLEDEFDMTTEEVRSKLTTVADTGEEHSAWADDAVKSMVDAEIFNGDGNGNFGWEQCITREAVAKILFNLLGKLDLLDQLK